MKVEILNKHFGEKVLFNNLSLSFPDNETSLIMGESGSGKTTLLRMIASLDRDYEGKIETKEERATMLFQENRLVENLSVLSNLLLVTDDEKKAEEYLNEVGLKGEEESIVNTLSGGMKRRVSIVRFLLVPSSLYLLDEPFSAMDEETIITTSKLIKRVVENKTTVVVTHNPLVKEILDAKLVVKL